MTWTMAALRAESSWNSDGGLISTSNSGCWECSITKVIVELSVSVELLVSVDSLVFADSVGNGVLTHLFMFNLCYICYIFCYTSL